MYGHFLFVQKTEPAETAGSDIFVIYRFNRSPADCGRRTDNHTEDRCHQKNWPVSRFGLQPERFKESECCVQHQNQ